MEHMDEVVKKVSLIVPRTRFHLCWRLALYLRCSGPLVNNSNHAHFTWAELHEIFRTTKNPAVFRYSVLRRKAEHAGHESPDFNVLTCDPAGLEKLQHDEELRAVAVSRTTLNEQMQLSLRDRAAVLTEKFQTKLSGQQLRQFYRDAMITKQRVSYRPSTNMKKEVAMKKRSQEAQQLFERYQYALHYGLRIIYIDEVKF